MKSATSTPASTALARVKVVDLSRVRAGPTAARQLADWGADVTTIEIPCSLDNSDPHVGSRESPDFQNLNRNKRSMTLNLKDKEGIAILKRVVEQADVLIENWRPRVKHRLGIDYDSLSRINPRLIYASISGFGQTGPYCDRPGFDQIAQAMGGLMSITGVAETGPMRVGVPIADLCSGLFCAYGIVVALFERELSGQGQWLHTSLLEAQAFMLDFQAARWLMGNEVASQDGNYHSTIAPCGTFAAADGDLSLAVVGQLMWTRFCRALDREQWMDLPDYASNDQRILNRARLHTEIELALGTKTRDHWVDHLNDASVPCGPVYRIDEMFDDPQLVHLGLVQDFSDPDSRRRKYLGQPLTMTRTPSAVTRRAPALGEHTDTVLEELGFSSAKIADLRARGVV